VFTIGIAPPTAASKLSATPFFSASSASRTPWRASSALLAVTTDLPAASAASTALLAGSPSPPIHSTKTSISGATAKRCGPVTQRILRRSALRFLPLERAVTATTAMRRSVRATSADCSSAIRRTTAAPTVPSPAIPNLRGATMKRPRLGHIPEKACPTRCRMKRRSPAFRERDDVVQLFRSGFKQPAQVAGRLADALVVFEQRDPHIALALFAKRDARRYRELGLLNQQGRKLDAADGPERFRERRPSEHRGARRRNVPAGAAKALHEHIPSPLVGLAHLADAVLGTVERRGCRHLHRRERAIVEIGLHPRQRRDDALVADRKSHPPPGHRKGLRH